MAPGAIRASRMRRRFAPFHIQRTIGGVASRHLRPRASGVGAGGVTDVARQGIGLGALRGRRGRRLAAGGLALGLALGSATALALPMLVNSPGGANSFIGGGDGNITYDDYNTIAAGQN